MTLISRLYWLCSDTQDRWHCGFSTRKNKARQGEEKLVFDRNCKIFLYHRKWKDICKPFLTKNFHISWWRGESKVSYKYKDSYFQENVGVTARQWRLQTTNANVREKYKGAMSLLEKIKSLINDVSLLDSWLIMTLGRKVSIVFSPSTASRISSYGWSLITGGWPITGSLPGWPNKKKLNFNQFC